MGSSRRAIKPSVEEGSCVLKVRYLVVVHQKHLVLFKCSAL